VLYPTRDGQTWEEILKVQVGVERTEAISANVLLDATTSRAMAASP
jgi:hypothetical protein